MKKSLNIYILALLAAVMLTSTNAMAQARKGTTRRTTTQATTPKGIRQTFTIGNTSFSMIVPTQLRCDDSPYETVRTYYDEEGKMLIRIELENIYQNCRNWQEIEQDLREAARELNMPLQTLYRRTYKEELRIAVPATITVRDYTETCQFHAIKRSLPSQTWRRKKADSYYNIYGYIRNADFGLHTAALYNDYNTWQRVIVSWIQDGVNNTSRVATMQPVE